MEFKSLKKIILPAVSITTSAMLLFGGSIYAATAEEVKKAETSMQASKISTEKTAVTKKSKKTTKKKKKKTSAKKAKKTQKAVIDELKLSETIPASITFEEKTTAETQIKKSGKETGAAVIFVLMEKKQAIVTDLIDTLLLFKNLPLENKTTEQKITELRNLGIIKPEITIDPKLEVRKGFASLLFYNAMGLKGGLSLRIAGPSTRNCFRELVYEKIMPESSERDKMTGPELVSLLQKAKDKMTAGDQETISSSLEGR